MVPRQRNLSDCGVFVLEYMERFLEDPYYILNDIDSNCLKLEWFPKTTIEAKRDMIIKLILSIRNQKLIKVIFLVTKNLGNT